MASPHIEARPLALPIIPPTSPFAVSSGQSSAKSPTTTASTSPTANSTTSRTPNPQPQPHIRSMLDVGTDTTPKKTNTPQQPNRPAPPIPSNIVATSSNDVISSDVPPTPPPKDIPIPQSNITPKTRPRSNSKPALRPAAAMTIDTSKSIPQPTPPEKRPPTQRKLSLKNNAPNSTKSNGTKIASPPSPTKEQKPKLARIRSFLKRSNSNAKNEIAPMTQVDGAAESHSLNSKETTSTNSTTVFMFSSRSSATSPSATPPSPGSPASTINEAASEPGMLEEENPLTKRYTHSQSYSNLDQQGPRMGITWGPGVATGRPKTPRRRSISTEHIPSVKKPGPMTGIKEEHDPRVILLPAFSQDADAGAGVKARRLSTCLPDEFWVDYCELDKEFKSASAVPLRRGKVVGKGATSTVRLMCRKGDPKGVFYAVKEFRARDAKHKETEEDYVKKVKSEYSIAKSLHHPNIVETVRLCTSHGHWCHIMEYCGNGELFGMVERGLFKPGGPFKLSDRLCLFKQMIRGIDYLHSHGIAHRDIKLENLLLTTEGQLKITDFGVSEVFSGEHPGLRASGGECGKNMKEVRRCAPGICGSMPYMAPEVLEKEGDYDPRPLDVWSCAMVYLTMTYGGSPWQKAVTENAYFNDFMNGWNKFLASHPEGLITDGAGNTPLCGRIFNAERLGSPALKRLILKMLHPIPEKRITIREVLTGPTVRGIECCSVESYENNNCCVDAKASGKIASKKVLHNHVPPKEHKTPKLFQHRFDMGDGYS